MGAEVFHVPLLFRLMCYMAGLAVYLGVTFWLGRAAMGKSNRYGFTATGFIWAARVLAFFTAVGVIQMLAMWNEIPKKSALVPGLAILYLLAAYGLTNIRERPFPWKDILLWRLPREALKSCAVTVMAAVSGGLVLVLGILFLKLGAALGAPPSQTLFVLGLILITPILLLFRRIQAKGSALRLTTILGMLIFTCLLLLVPEFFDHAGSSPKVQEMLHAPPRLGKV